MREYGGVCSQCGCSTPSELLAALAHPAYARVSRYRTPERVPYAMVGEVRPMCSACRRAGHWRSVQRITPKPRKVRKPRKPRALVAEAMRLAS